jgi:hypothetical protein
MLLQPLAAPQTISDFGVAARSSPHTACDFVMPVAMGAAQ